MSKTQWKFSRKPAGKMRITSSKRMILTEEYLETLLRIREWANNHSICFEMAMLDMLRPECKIRRIRLPRRSHWRSVEKRIARGDPPETW